MPSATSTWLARRTHLLIPLLILLPVLWALLPGGLPNSADGMVHFTRITEIVSSWRDGILIPRWSLNLGFGYGIPVFIFGPPLSYWLGALYNLLGFGPETAYKAMLVTILIIGANGAYRLGQVLLGICAGAVAAVAFIYAPNQLFTLFVQGNAPQLLAWSLLPWALWATIQIYRAERQRHQLLFGGALALAVSGTFISHNVVALILVPTVAALAIMLWIATRSFRALCVAAGGGLLGALMSAWFTVPALLETVYASTDAIVASDYHGRFVPLAELLAWPARLDAGAINPYIARTLGLPGVIVAGIGVVALVGGALVSRLSHPAQTPEQAGTEGIPIDANLSSHRRESLAKWRQVALSFRRRRNPLLEWDSRRNRDSSSQTPRNDTTAGVDLAEIRLMLAPSNQRVFWGTAIFMLLYTLICVWMATEQSVRIWEIFPLLNFFQFPARWIGFAGFGLAWLAGAATGLPGRRWQPMWAGAICLFLMATAFVNLYPDKTPPGTHTMSPHEVVRYEVKSGAIGTTSYGEFNPRWAPRPLPASPMTEDYMAQQPVDRLKGMLPEGASHQILEVTAHHQRYQITLPAAATISINLLYFPGWWATVNGQALAIWPQEGTGLITFALPAGESLVDFRFGPTPLRRAMGWLSSATWILLALAFGLLMMSRTSAPAAETPLIQEGGRAIAVVASVVAMALVVQMGGAPWFQLASPPDQALAASIPRHDDVGDRFRLLGQDRLPSSVRPGATLPVVAYWRSLQSMDENYAVVLSLEDVGSGQTLVTMEQSHPSDIPTSGWATGLYVRNEWQLTIPAAALPLQYVLRIGFRDPNSGAMLPTQEGSSLELGRLWVQPATQPKPPAGPNVRFGANIELLGARSDSKVLTLYWRANQATGEDDHIFIHLLDAQGEVVGQMDGLPYENRYPTWAWRPGQIIEDRRDVAASGFDLARIAKIATGLYDPTTNTRLTAVDSQGNALPDNALMIPWPAP